MTLKGPAIPWDEVKEPKKPKGRQERFDERKDNALRVYVRGLRCVLLPLLGANCDGDIEAAHVKSKGAAGGDFDNVVPLCQRHHREQHQVGVKSFEYKYGVRLKAAAHKVTADFCALRKHGGKSDLTTGKETR